MSGMNQTYVKLYRRLMHWEWKRQPLMVALWADLLIHANIKDRFFEGERIRAGELVTSLASLSERTGLSISQVRTCLKRLRETGYIAERTSSQYRVITLVGWGEEQGRVAGGWQADDRRVTGASQHYKKGEQVEQEEGERRAPSYMKTYEQEMGRMQPGVAVQAREFAQAMDEEVVELALREAVRCGAPHWSYARAVLESWQQRGIRTGADVRAMRGRQQVGDAGGSMMAQHEYTEEDLVRRRRAAMRMVEEGEA